MKPDLEKMESSSYLLCEACGGYHTEDECEVVIVKIVKGKNCKLNMTKEHTANLNNTPKIFENEKRSVETEMTVSNQPQVPPRRTPSIVPPSFGAMMVPPTDPAFETKGKKEIRRV